MLIRNCPRNCRLPWYVWFAVAAATGSLFGTAKGRAADQAPEPPMAHFGGQRYFGVGPTVGFWSGLGGLVGGGGEMIKGWVSGGYVPLLIFGNARSDRAVRANYYSAGQINTDLTACLFHRNGVEAGLLLGYKYNTVIGHGAGGGVSVLYDLGRHLGLALFVGFTVFPSARVRLEENFGYPADRSPSLPWLEGGANAGLVFYP